MHSDEIIPLSIKRLLSDEKYLIPIYQRNYDWGEKESLQLIQDIADCASTKKGKKYYTRRYDWNRVVCHATLCDMHGYIHHAGVGNRR